MCTIVKTIEQGQRIGKAIVSAVAVGRAKTTPKKTCKEERYLQSPGCVRKTPVKSNRSVNQSILSSIVSVLDFGNPAAVLFNRSKQLSLNSLLSNHPNGQFTYIHKIVGTGKTIVHALHTANQVIFKRAAHFTLPQYIKGTLPPFLPFSFLFSLVSSNSAIYETDYSCISYVLLHKLSFFNAINYN